LTSDKKKRGWKKYNEELVRRGELLFDPDFLSGWEEELNRLNEKKQAQRISYYPNSLTNVFAHSHPRISSSLRAGRGVYWVFAEHEEVFKGRKKTSSLYNGMVLKSS
jgi:hypothetical protein